MDNKKRVQKLVELGMPLLEFVKESCSPYEKVIIDSESIRIESVEVSVPVNQFDIE